MFYVGGSSILKVLEGPGIDGFSGVALTEYKRRPWEALWEIWVIFRCHLEDHNPQKIQKYASQIVPCF